jgi:hypothetical protein
VVHKPQRIDGPVHVAIKTQADKALLAGEARDCLPRFAADLR